MSDINIKNDLASESLSAKSSIYEASPKENQNVFNTLQSVSLDDLLLSMESTEVQLEAETSSEDLEIKPIEQSLTTKDIIIILIETNTIFLFDLPCKSVDKNSEEGPLVEEDNKTYDYLSIGKGRNRKTINNETQTVEKIVRMVFTSIPSIEMKNSYAFASKWDMFDSFAAKNVKKDKLKSSISLDSEESNDSFEIVDSLLSLFNSTIIMERVLANNIFKTQHEYYKVLKSDKIEDNKNLLHLWSFVVEDLEGFAVTDMCWNKKNNDILAVGYGKYFFTDDKNGFAAIWSIKNPMHPERIYEFTTPITSMEFSYKNPNFLAIGFYNGDISVLDITFREKKIIAHNDRSVYQSYAPIWEIKWHNFDENNHNLISIEDNGEINRFTFTKTKRLIKTQLLKIIEVTDDNNKHLDDIPISKYSSSLVYCKHPSLNDVYLIGMSNGNVYKCSMNNLRQYIDMFQAHDGPVYNIQFSNFDNKIFLTCGSDWVVKIWIENITEPLIVLKTYNPVEYASFCPTHPTIIAAISNKNIFLWDLNNTYNMLAMKMKIDPKLSQLTKMMFTIDGKNLIAGDIKGGIHVYNLSSFVDFDNVEEKNLIEKIKQALVIKPDLLKKFNKLLDDK